MKNLRFYFFSFLIFVVVFGLVSPLLVLAQVAPADNAAKKAQLEAELQAVLQDLAVQQKLLLAKQKETGTIKGDLDALTAQINKAKLTIKAKKLEIEKIGGQITKHQDKIQTLNQRITKEQVSLAELLRKRRELDDITVASVLLDDGSLDDIFVDDNSFFSLEKSMHQSFNSLRGVKVETESEKARLQKQRDAELDAQAKIESEKKVVESKESDKKVLLSISKSKEQEYQALVADRQRKAADIRARLFQFASGAAVPAIPFADAVRYAESASKFSGVRTALILAIIQQETSYGKNTGACLLTDPATGNGVGANTGTPFAKVMKPDRDVAPFIEIAKSLGRDPFKTRVSCPIGGVGYGGAMGYAQFIPSTWNLFKPRIASLVGKSVPDPWSPVDAFTATALYLADRGAAAQTYSAERTSACRYYGGGTICTAVTGVYGNSVMAIAQGLQDDIDYVKQYGSAKAN